MTSGGAWNGVVCATAAAALNKKLRIGILTAILPIAVTRPSEIVISPSRKRRLQFPDRWPEILREPSGPCPPGWPAGSRPQSHVDGNSLPERPLPQGTADDRIVRECRVRP